MISKPMHHDAAVHGVAGSIAAGKRAARQDVAGYGAARQGAVGAMTSIRRHYGVAGRGGAWLFGARRGPARLGMAWARKGVSTQKGVNQWENISGPSTLIRWWKIV